MQEITRGRVAAISVPVNSTENLVTVIELKKRADLETGADGDAVRWLTEVKSDVTSAIANAHGVNVGDLVLVPPRVDSDDDERQDPAHRLRRAIPAGPVHPVGRLSRTGQQSKVWGTGRCVGEGGRGGWQCGDSSHPSLRC